MQTKRVLLASSALLLAGLIGLLVAVSGTSSTQPRETPSVRTDTLPHTAPSANAAPTSPAMLPATAQPGSRAIQQALPEPSDDPNKLTNDSTDQFAFRAVAATPSERAQANEVAQRTKAELEAWDREHEARMARGQFKDADGLAAIYARQRKSLEQILGVERATILLSIEIDAQGAEIQSEAEIAEKLNKE